MQTKTKNRVNLWRLLLILLAVVVLSTYLVSWLLAKFTSFSDSDDGARVANFSCSASIDGVSALSFTNTAFWGGTPEGDRIAMNALRTLYFSVRNFEEVDGEAQVSEVAMYYDLIFATPQNFAEKLAIQALGESGEAMFPQIALSDLLSTPDGGALTVGEAAYNGLDFEDLTFTVTVSDGIYTATAGEYEIRVEPVKLELTQTVSFRLWDVSELTNETYPSVSNEAGELCAPLEVQFSQLTDCYRISVFSPEFRMPAGVETTVEHSITLTPVAALNDDHLGGFLVDDANKFIKSIKGGDSLQITTIKETFVDTYADGTVTAPTTVSLIGGKKNYKAGETETEVVSTTVDSVAKSYSFDGEVTSSETVEEGSWCYYNEDMGTLDSEPNFFTKGYRIKRTDYKKTTDTTTYTVLAIASSQQTMVTTTTAVEGDTVSQIVETITETHYEISSGVKITVKTETYTSTYECQQKSSWSTSWSDSIAITNPEQYLPVPPNTSSSEEVPMSDDEILALESKDWQTVDESFTRTITRTYETNAITAATVSRFDGDEMISYTSAAPFELYTDGVQKFYLSQCYAKSYPMTVDVRFEQAPE